MVHRESASWLFFASSTFAAHWFHAALSSRSISRFSAPSTLLRISTCSWAVALQLSSAPSASRFCHRPRIRAALARCSRAVWACSSQRFQDATRARPNQNAVALRSAWVNWCFSSTKLSQRLQLPTRAPLVHSCIALRDFCARSTESSHWFHAALSSRSISRARAPSTFARISTM